MDNKVNQISFIAGIIVGRRLRELREIRDTVETEPTQPVTNAIVGTAIVGVAIVGREGSTSGSE